MEKIVVSGSFDNIQSRQVRFLEEAARFGPVHVFLWSDEVVKAMTGAGPKFPEEERKHILKAVRFVHKIQTVDQLSSLDELPQGEGFKPRMWVVMDDNDTHQKRRYCLTNEIVYTLIKDTDLNSFPIPSIDDVQSSPNPPPRTAIGLMIKPSIFGLENAIF
jgi:glycerol-3-phosphate cytidylyltransferase-like family protein